MEVRRPLKGTVKRWLMGRGYGFIEPDEGGSDVFVHHSEIGGLTELREGQKVEFEVQSTYKGPRAINVKLIE
jgi:CspA family cold shock protein